MTFAPIEAADNDTVEQAVLTPPDLDDKVVEAESSTSDQMTATKAEIAAEDAATEDAATDAAAAEETGNDDSADSSPEPTAEPTAEAEAEAPLTTASIAVLDGLLRVEAPQLPSWLALTATEAGDALLTGMPLTGAEGEHLIELIAIDGAGVVITQSFTLTVELDPAPFRIETMRFETTEDTPVDGVLSAEHIEGAAIFFRVEEGPDSGEITALDESSGAFTYTPLPDFYGEDGFTVEISDEFQRIITAPVSITVDAVNDPPLIVLDDMYTVTIGDVVTLPIVTTDVEEDAVTIAADTLPPDLFLSEEGEVVLISGEVAPAAAEGSPFVTTITITDANDASTTHTLTWIVEAIADAPADDEPLPADADAETGADSEADPNADAADQAAEADGASEADATPIASVILLASQATPLLDSDATATHAWQSPPPYTGCPVVAGALTPAPLAGALLDDTQYDTPTSAPVLRFETELPAGDYALLVCGCAPTYSSDEGASLPASNQALFAGVDGIAHLSPAGDAVMLTGFAQSTDFTWQPLLASEVDPTPAIITVPDDGMHTVDLWMADDGVIVTAIKLAPAANLDEVQTTIGQSCASDS